MMRFVSAANVLLVVGAFLELVGIVLVGSPDLFPGAQQLSEWIARQVDRGWRWVLRAFGRVRPRTHSVHLSGGIELGGHVSAFVSTSAESVEEKVEFLLRRDREHQQDIGELKRKVGELERESAKRLERLRADLEEQIRAEIAAAHGEYLPLRIVGAFALAAGLVCVTAGALM